MLRNLGKTPRKKIAHGRERCYTLAHAKQFAGRNWRDKMNRPTLVFVQTIRQMPHGSDWYGACEVCGSSDVSRSSTWQKKQIWEKDDGTMYLNSIGGGVVGHAGCLIKALGDAYGDSQFLRVGNLKTVNDAQFRMIQSKQKAAA